MAVSWRIATGSLCALVLLPATAEADEELNVALSWGVLHKRELPALRTTEDIETPARTIPKDARIANTGGVTMFGGALDFAFVFDDRVRVPLLGFGFYGAVGSYAPTLSSVDGSLVRMRRSTAWEFDVLLPGIGVRSNLRRWMVAADVRFGVGFLGENASVVAGSGTYAGDAGTAMAVSSFVDLNLMGCRRLDPFQRLCLQATLRLWDFGAVNGFTIGMRWEIGP